MRQFMARSGERGVTVTMILERLKAEHIPVSDRSVRRWLAEDTDAGITERATHLLWRMRAMTRRDERARRRSPEATGRSTGRLVAFPQEHASVVTVVATLRPDRTRFPASPDTVAGHTGHRSDTPDTPDTSNALTSGRETV
jgi:hypothetical protein